jgi:hypothetical protein
MTKTSAMEAMNSMVVSFGGLGLLSEAWLFFFFTNRVLSNPMAGPHAIT